jgi:hypothetical protein
MIKQLARACLGDRNIGRLEFLLLPRSGDVLGGPLNGQEFRRRMFREILEAIDCEAIVETGTFRGSTTDFFATFGPPVYSVEVNPRHAAFASMRLAKKRDRVHLFEGSSPTFLRGLTTDPAFPRSNVFFYLDAHWFEHLPLAEELEIIYGAWPDAVVMVDDFKVPGTSYAYDDYGPGKALTPEYLEPLRHLGLVSYFPAAAAEQETGLRRGSVVLCHDPAVSKRLAALPTLVSADELR